MRKSISGIVVIVTIILAMGFLSSAIKPAYALTAPSVDGTAVGLGVATSGTMILPAMTITTGHVDVLIVSYFGDSGVNIASISSTGNPTWTERADVLVNSENTLSTWYAIWTSTGSTTITLTLTGPEGNTHCVAVAFAVQGANTVNPFDVNAVTATEASGIPTTSITTTQNDDLVIGALGVENQLVPSTGASFTLITSETADANTRSTAVECQGISTAGHVTVDYRTTGSCAWGIIADAIAPHNPLFVTPEYSLGLGTLLALSACFAAFALYTTQRKHNDKTADNQQEVLEEHVSKYGWGF